MIPPKLKLEPQGGAVEKDSKDLRKYRFAAVLLGKPSHQLQERVTLDAVASLPVFVSIGRDVVVVERENEAKGSSSSRDFSGSEQPSAHSARTSETFNGNDRQFANAVYVIKISEIEELATVAKHTIRLRWKPSFSFQSPETEDCSNTPRPHRGLTESKGPTVAIEKSEAEHLIEKDAQNRKEITLRTVFAETATSTIAKFLVRQRHRGVSLASSPLSRPRALSRSFSFSEGEEENRRSKRTRTEKHLQTPDVKDHRNENDKGPGGGSVTYAASVGLLSPGRLFSPLRGGIDLSVAPPSSPLQRKRVEHRGMKDERLASHTSRTAESRRTESPTTRSVIFQAKSMERLGMKLESVASSGSKQIGCQVAGFTQIGATPGEAEASQNVFLQDIIVAINGTSVVSLSFADIIATIRRRVDRGDLLVLTFQNVSKQWLSQRLEERAKEAAAQRKEEGALEQRNELGTGETTSETLEKHKDLQQDAKGEIGRKGTSLKNSPLVQRTVGKEDSQPNKLSESRREMVIKSFQSSLETMRNETDTLSIRVANALSELRLSTKDSVEEASSSLPSLLVRDCLLVLDSLHDMKKRGFLLGYALQSAALLEKERDQQETHTLERQAHAQSETLAVLGQRLSVLFGALREITDSLLQLQKSLERALPYMSEGQSSSNDDCAAWSANPMGRNNSTVKIESNTELTKSVATYDEQKEKGLQERLEVEKYEAIQDAVHSAISTMKEEMKMRLERLKEDYEEKIQMILLRQNHSVSDETHTEESSQLYQSQFEIVSLRGEGSDDTQIQQVVHQIVQANAVCLVQAQIEVVSIAPAVESQEKVSQTTQTGTDKDSFLANTERGTTSSSSQTEGELLLKLPSFLSTHTQTGFSSVSVSTQRVPFALETVQIESTPTVALVQAETQTYESVSFASTQTHAPERSSLHVQTDVSGFTETLCAEVQTETLPRQAKVPYVCTATQTREKMFAAATTHTQSLALFSNFTQTEEEKKKQVYLHPAQTQTFPEPLLSLYQTETTSVLPSVSVSLGTQTRVRSDLLSQCAVLENIPAQESQSVQIQTEWSEIVLCTLATQTDPPAPLQQAETQTVQKKIPLNSSQTQTESKQPSILTSTETQTEGAVLAGDRASISIEVQTERSTLADVCTLTEIHTGAAVSETTQTPKVEVVSEQTQIQSQSLCTLQRFTLDIESEQCKLLVSSHTQTESYRGRVLYQSTAVQTEEDTQRLHRQGALGTEPEQLKSLVFDHNQTERSTEERNLCQSIAVQTEEDIQGASGRNLLETNLEQSNLSISGHTQTESSGERSLWQSTAVQTEEDARRVDRRKALETESEPFKLFVSSHTQTEISGERSVCSTAAQTEEDFNRVHRQNALETESEQAKPSVSSHTQTENSGEKGLCQSTAVQTEEDTSRVHEQNASKTRLEQFRSLVSSYTQTDRVDERGVCRSIAVQTEEDTYRVHKQKAPTTDLEQSKVLASSHTQTDRTEEPDTQRVGRQNTLKQERDVPFACIQTDQARALATAPAISTQMEIKPVEGEQKRSVDPQSGAGTAPFCRTVWTQTELSDILQEKERQKKEKEEEPNLDMNERQQKSREERSNGAEKERFCRTVWTQTDLSDILKEKERQRKEKLEEQQKTCNEAVVDRMKDFHNTLSVCKCISEVSVDGVDWSQESSGLVPCYTLLTSVPPTETESQGIQTVEINFNEERRPGSSSALRDNQTSLGASFRKRITPEWLASKVAPILVHVISIPPVDILTKENRTVINERKGFRSEQPFSAQIDRRTQAVLPLVSGKTEEEEYAEQRRLSETLLMSQEDYWSLRQSKVLLLQSARMQLVQCHRYIRDLSQKVCSSLSFVRNIHEDNRQTKGELSFSFSREDSTFLSVVSISLRPLQAHLDAGQELTPSSSPPLSPICLSPSLKSPTAREISTDNSSVPFDAISGFAPENDNVFPRIPSQSVYDPSSAALLSPQRALEDFSSLSISQTSLSLPPSSSPSPPVPPSKKTKLLSSSTSFANLSLREMVSQMLKELEKWTEHSKHKASSSTSDSLFSLSPFPSLQELGPERCQAILTAIAVAAVSQRQKMKALLIQSNNRVKELENCCQRVRMSFRSALAPLLLPPCQTSSLDPAPTHGQRASKKEKKFSPEVFASSSPNPFPPLTKEARENTRRSKLYKAAHRPSLLAVREGRQTTKNHSTIITSAPTNHLKGETQSLKSSLESKSRAVGVRKEDAKEDEPEQDETEIGKPENRLAVLAAIADAIKLIDDSFGSSISLSAGSTKTEAKA